MSGQQPNTECIFWAALALESGADRAQYLEQACGTDQKLRAQVEELLAAQPKVRDFLEAPAPALAATIDKGITEHPGTRIGPYKLLEQIGEGGMGVVYVAEQQQPVRRKVALKLIKPGMDTKQVIARFEAERQALAMMDHPNIAKVHDGGATPEGRPYFVMELVKGTPITDYCDRNRLGMHQRLELFRDVCQAVQHAHQKGIIHRDLKPSNILVEVHDVRPVVKIIDFGIIKAIGQQLTDKTLHTGIAQMIGTPLYMSPEQAGLSSLDVDTRSDVYALGVLLYELLTGSTPFDGETLKKAGYDEMRRIVREDEPPKPSTRLSTLGIGALSTISERRSTDPRKISHEVRGELDWIVMKALEKDRNRRYESASALAADVERYLQDEPVEACPPSRRYRLGKFLRKHRTGVLTAAALLVLALVLGAVFGWVALDQAAQRAATEQAVNADLTEAEFWWQQKQWAKAIPALERASGRLVGSGLESLQHRVETRRRDAALAVRLELASMQGFPGWYMERDIVAVAVDRAYRSAFGEYGLDVAALTPEESARRIRVSAIRIQIVTALDNWAFYLDHWTKDKDALHGGGASLRAIAQLADDDDWRRQLRDPRVIKDRVALERLADGEAVTTQSSENVMVLFHLLEQATNGPDFAVLGSQHAGVRMLLRMQQLHPADFWINLSLGMHLMKKATAADAIGFCRAAVAAQPHNPFVYRVLGDNLSNQKKLPEAEAAYRKATELRTDLAGAHSMLGNALAQQKKHAEAQAAYRKVEAAYRKAIELNPKDAPAYTNLGDVLARQNKLIEAEAACRKAIELNPEHALAYRELGMALSGQNKNIEAEAAIRTAIKLKPNDATAYFFLGAVLVSQRKFPEMEAANRKAIELRPDYCEAYLNLGWALVQQQKYVEAVAAYRKLFDNDPNSSSHYPAAMAAALAGCGQGKDTASLDAKERGQLRGQALAWIRVILTASQKKLAAEPVKEGPGVQEDMQDLQRDRSFTGVRAEDALAKLPEAERWKWHALWQEVEELKRRAEVAREAELRQRLATLAEKQPDDWTTFNTQALLGETLLGQKRYAEAEPLLLEGYEGLKKRQANVPGPPKGRVLEALGLLPRLYDAWGRKEKADRWRVEQEQAEPGFVRAWLALSEPVPYPYPPGDGIKALDQEQIPGVALLRPRAGDKVEAGGKGLVWKEHHSPERHIDLVALYDGAPSDYRVAYLICYVHAEADRTDLVLRVGSDDLAKVYLNGQEVYRETKYRRLTVDEDEVKPIALRKGSNVVVFKVVNGDGGWAGCLHFRGKDGRPVEGLRFGLEPE